MTRPETGAKYLAINEGQEFTINLQKFLLAQRGET